MIYYDLVKLLSTVPISFVCGAFASLIITGERIILSCPVYCTRAALGIRSLQDFRLLLKTKIKIIPQTHLTAFVSPITFFIIYILLSYIMLSGQTRLYVFLIMLFGFLLSEKFLSGYAARVVITAFFSVTLLAVYSLRMIKKTFIFLFKPRIKSKKTIDNNQEVL